MRYDVIQRSGPENARTFVARKFLTVEECCSAATTVIDDLVIESFGAVINYRLDNRWMKPTE